MKVELVDIGANLTHESFAADRALVIARAARAGVTRQVITGADLLSSQAAAAMTAAASADAVAAGAGDDTGPSRLWSTAGVHPHHAAAFSPLQRDELRELLLRPRVVAVGECGLDYFRNLSPPAAQRAAFIAQLEIAAAAAKPVFLHQRDAHADFKAILTEHRGGLVGGVAHCFTGDSAQLEDYLALGLSIGVTGWVCDERRGGSLRDAVPRIPSDRLMLETDAPYLLPRDLQPLPRSRRNEPQYLVHIARTVARLRDEPWETLAATSTRNAIAFFGLDAGPD